jgi:lysophospholipase L1-like esterase
MQLKKLNPSLSFLVLAMVIELLERTIDRLVGDADGNITSFKLSIVITFFQLFLAFLTLLWLPEVVYRFRGNARQSSQNVFERNAFTTLISFVVFVVWVADFTVAQLYFGKQQKIAEEKQAKSFRIESEHYHHDLRANKQGQDLWGDSTYAMATNSLGFKDAVVREISLKADKKRILFIGDSFTEGIGLPYQQTFAGMFAAAVQDSIEVLNAGCVSYSPKLYYLKTKYLIEKTKLRFDELFVFIDISDIQDETVYASFIEKDSLTKRAEQPKNQVIANKSIENKQTTDAKHSLFSFLNFANLFPDFNNNSIIFYALYSRFAPIDNSQKLYYEERPNWTLNDSIYQKWGIKGVALAQENMKKLVVLCNQKQIKLTIAIYPWNQQVKQRDINSKQVQIWTQFAAQNQLQLINFFPHFINAESADYETFYKKYYITGDVHWNEAGNKFFADALLKYFGNRKP